MNRLYELRGEIPEKWKRVRREGGMLGRILEEKGPGLGLEQSRTAVLKPSIAVWKDQE